MPLPIPDLDNPKGFMGPSDDIAEDKLALEKGSISEKEIPSLIASTKVVPEPEQRDRL